MLVADSKHGPIACAAAGAHYHLIHSVALLALGDGRPRTQALWVIGIALFSGSLYMLSFSKRLGIVTPFGGCARRQRLRGVSDARARSLAAQHRADGRLG